MGSCRMCTAELVMVVRVNHNRSQALTAERHWQCCRPPSAPCVNVLGFLWLQPGSIRSAFSWSGAGCIRLLLVFGCWCCLAVVANVAVVLYCTVAVVAVLGKLCPDCALEECTSTQAIQPTGLMLTLVGVQLSACPLCFLTYRCRGRT